MKSPPLGLAADPVLVMTVVQAPRCSSASFSRLWVSSFSRAWAAPSRPGKAAAAPVRMAVAVFPRRLRSSVGEERITDGRGG